MRHPLGLIVLCLAAAPAFGQEVGHTCVEGCDNAPPPEAAPAPSAPAAPSQQDMINQQIIDGVQQGVTQAIQQYKADQQRAQQARAARIQQKELEQRQALTQEQQQEAQRRQQSRDEAVGDMLPLAPAPSGELPTAFTRPIRKPVVKVDYANAARRERKAMMCALAPVFSRSRDLGPDAQEALQTFRSQIDELEKELAQPPGDDPNAQLVTQPRLHVLTQGPRARQLVADALAVRHEDTGQVTLSVQYHYSADGKSEEGQTVVRTDKYGRVAEQESSPATTQCLAKID